MSKRSSVDNVSKSIKKSKPVDGTDISTNLFYQIICKDQVLVENDEITVNTKTTTLLQVTIILILLYAHFYYSNY
jgi:hypothetical protein